MKRFDVLSILMVAILLGPAIRVFAAPISVVNSKHNLSSIASSGTGSIHASGGSGGTSEICVFCHTPHAGNTQAPLWNRAASVASYVSYTSDVLAGLSYYPGEDPSNVGAAGYNVHVKSRLCLSCHDGTIALGQLANLPYNPATGSKLTSNVAMVNANPDGTMPTAAAGYIGIDLQDDHPVAIPHDNTKDPELRGTILGGFINLYQLNAGVVQKTTTAGAANYVECTSCHNAHDNENGFFLVQPNSGSSLCTNCHSKQLGAGTSAHDASAVGYNPDGAGTIGTTVGGVKCMNCHYSHKSGVDPLNMTQPNTSYGKYLLSFQEEGTCFNKTNRWGRATTVCHGSTSTTKNIESEELKASAHRDTATYAGIHQATEQGYGWLGAGNTKWHVECADCHNSHTAGSTKHIAASGINGNRIGNSSPLYGASCVAISWTGPWSVPGSAGFQFWEALGLTNSTTMPPNYYEYQICMKCHSSYGWGINTPPVSPSLGGGLLMTDQALEFNPGNTYANGASAHPIAGATGHVDGALTPLPVNWQTNQGSQTMYCSDCHNTNNGAAPQGSHGSANPFILTSVFTDTYTVKGTVQANGELCFTCHDYNTYAGLVATFNIGGSGFSDRNTTNSTNLHAQHAIRSSASTTSAFGYMCVNCHTRIPHGYNSRGMIVLMSAGPPYAAGGTGAGKINSYSPPAAPTAGYYAVGFANRNSNCTTVAGCHQ